MINICETELEQRLLRATQLGESVGLAKAYGVVMDEAKEEFATRGNTDVAKILRNIAITLKDSSNICSPVPPNDYDTK